MKKKSTANVVIFAGGKFCKNVGKSPFRWGIILLFPS